MKKNLKRTIGLICAIMFITFTFTPRTLLATAEENDVHHMIYLKSMEINTEENSMSLKSLKEEDSINYIISFNGPIEEYMKDEITELGAELIEYIPDFAYLSIIESEILSDVSALPYVENILIYQPEYKINPNFSDKNSLEIDVDEKTTIRVFTFNDSSDLVDHIEELGETVLYSSEKELIVELDPKNINDLAEFDSVKYIEPYVEYELFNDKARNYMGVNGINTLGHNGQGQVVAVCDTGLDTGINDNSMHQDFSGRIDNIFALGRPTADDVHGHGTHVSGSVLGSGEQSNGQIKGIAPEAHLIMQSVLDSNGGLNGLPNDLNDLFLQAQNAGANIHTNSWGAAVYGDYNGSSQDVDEYVWDHNDMIILFAAGNEGDGSYGTAYNSIGSPGTAKNCITVGATENDRPNMGDTRWGNIGDNPDEIAAFSSRGNCLDGRTKPDIVAPGTWILSTKSSVAPVSNYWKDYDAYYGYMGGTSMSTPLTAGAVAAARGYMEDEWNHTPSAAMMKAAVINGGTDMGFGLPSRDQGWGRINLEESLKNHEYKWVDQEYSLTTGEKMNFLYLVESVNTPLKISLVWSDYPGSTSASKALVNDLDVKVTSPSGIEYNGNDFRQPYNNSTDRLNNVENIFIDTPETGVYVVEVKGFNVPEGPQPFALYSSGDFGDTVSDTESPTCTLTSPTNGDTVDGLLEMEVNAQDNVAVQKVEFYFDNNKIGEDTYYPYSCNFNTVTVNNGNHTVYAKAFDLADNEGISDEITVTVNNIDDNVIPTCSITSPVNNDTVYGIVPICVEAQDNVGVQKVEYYVDNEKIGEDNTYPYSFGWNVNYLTNGTTYTLQAKAIDTSGNEGVSSTVSVVVDNSLNIDYVTEVFTGKTSFYECPEFNIRATALGTIDLDLAGSDPSVTMQLYAPDGTIITFSHSTISYELEDTGDYTIIISTVNMNEIDYNLTATYPINPSLNSETEE